MMKMTFRWYGEKDPVTLNNIRQIPGMYGIVSAIYDTPVGEVWSRESIKKLKNSIEEKGLKFEVVESVPVHEDIKLGNSNAKKFIENYKENIRRLGEAGVKVICYNFMPVFDWLRSNLETQNADGSNSLSYEHKTVLNMNPLSGDLSLPGWDSSYTKDMMKDLLNSYKKIDEEGLWHNIEVFLKEIIPVAEEAKVKMAIHPDDPPWGIFGLPRIITNQKNIERFLSLENSPYNGITLCSGSLGVSRDNDLVKMIHGFKGRIHFAHLRNVLNSGEKDFKETAHLSSEGSLDMYEIVKALYETGFDGYIRPDHGRMIWGEKGRYGYGLFDRALGAVYINGLIEAVTKNSIKG